jgi:hypothetical protein
MKRNTISDEWKSPHDGVIPLKSPERAQANHDDEPSAGKSRVTFMASDELMSRARDVVYWERLQISAFIEDAIADAVKRFEKKHGGAYPRRKQELKAGRPVK